MGGGQTPLLPPLPQPPLLYWLVTYLSCAQVANVLIIPKRSHHCGAIYYNLRTSYLITQQKTFLYKEAITL